MGYCIKLTDADIFDALRRIACEQLDKAIDGLHGKDDVDGAIHNARKACKKLRGLIRLVRTSFPDYGAENRALRDAARRLSDLREGAAGLEAFGRLQRTYADRLTGLQAQSVREALEARARAMRYDDFEDRLAAFDADLKACRKRAEIWAVNASGFPALKGGLQKTYKRARRQFVVARDSRDATELHKWRKRVKYHWYHARLLQQTTPEELMPRIDELDVLAGLLGDHQDYADLTRLLEAGMMPSEAAHAVRAPMMIEMNRLQSRTFDLASRALRPEPRELTRIYRQGWNTWCS